MQYNTLALLITLLLLLLPALSPSSTSIDASSLSEQQKQQLSSILTSQCKPIISDRSGGDNSNNSTLISLSDVSEFYGIFSSLQRKEDSETSTSTAKSKSFSMSLCHTSAFGGACAATPSFIATDNCLVNSNYIHFSSSPPTTSLLVDKTAAGGSVTRVKFVFAEDTKKQVAIVLCSCDRDSDGGGNTNNKQKLSIPSNSFSEQATSPDGNTTFTFEVTSPGCCLPNPDEKPPFHLTFGQTIGIIAGSIIFVILVAGLIIFYKFSKNNKYVNFDLKNNEKLQQALLKGASSATRNRIKSTLEGRATGLHDGDNDGQETNPQDTEARLLIYLKDYFLNELDEQPEKVITQLAAEDDDEDENDEAEEETIELNHLVACQVILKLEMITTKKVVNHHERGAASVASVVSPPRTNTNNFYVGLILRLIVQNFLATREVLGGSRTVCLHFCRRLASLVPVVLKQRDDITKAHEQNVGELISFLDDSMRFIEKLGGNRREEQEQQKLSSSPSKGKDTGNDKPNAEPITSINSSADVYENNRRYNNDDEENDRNNDDDGDDESKPLRPKSSLVSIVVSSPNGAVKQAADIDDHENEETAKMSNIESDIPFLEKFCKEIASASSPRTKRTVDSSALILNPAIVFDRLHEKLSEIVLTFVSSLSPAPSTSSFNRQISAETTTTTTTTTASAGEGGNAAAAAAAPLSAESFMRATSLKSQQWILESVRAPPVPEELRITIREELRVIDVCLDEMLAKANTLGSLSTSEVIITRKRIAGMMNSLLKEIAEISSKEGEN